MRSLRYKVYYSLQIETRTVRVFHVRHWARRGLEVDELRQILGEPADQGTVT